MWSIKYILDLCKKSKEEKILEVKKSEPHNSRVTTEVPCFGHKHSLSMTSKMNFLKSNEMTNDDWGEESKYTDDVSDYQIDALKKNSFIMFDKKKTVDDLEYYDAYHKKHACPSAKKYLSKATAIPGYFIAEPKLLSKNQFEKVILSSFPGSGTEVLRYYLESTSKILTGSDTECSSSTYYTSSAPSFLADGKTNNKVWISASHYPHIEKEQEFEAHRWVLLVREPAETIKTYYKSTLKKANQDDASFTDINKVNDMDQFINDASEEWVKFSEYWMSIDRKIPVYIIKYEDLISNPYSTLVNLFWFLLSCKKDNIKGTLIDLLIKDAVKKYKPQMQIPDFLDLDIDQKHDVADLTFNICKKLKYKVIGTTQVKISQSVYSNISSYNGMFLFYLSFRRRSWNFLNVPK